MTIVTGRATKEGVWENTFFLTYGPFHFTLTSKMFTALFMSKTEIIVPASTSNLGASFDTCGLALSLYLRLEVEPQARGFTIIPSGEGADKVPLDESNIMLRAALYAAEARRQKLLYQIRNVNSYVIDAHRSGTAQTPQPLPGSPPPGFLPWDWSLDGNWLAGWQPPLLRQPRGLVVYSFAQQPML